MTPIDWVYLVLSVSASLSLLLYVFTNYRFKVLELRDRAAEAGRRDGARAADMALAAAEADWETVPSVNPDPSVPGDYITLSFDKGPDVYDEDFQAAIHDALALPYLLAGLGGRREAGIEMRVHRATYENPLTFILIVAGTTYAIGNIVLWVRNINAAIQEVERSSAETGEITARHNFQAKLYDTLSDVIDEDDQELNQARLERLQQVAEIAAKHGLLNVTHNQVTPLEAGRRTRVIQSSGPTRQLE